MKRSSILMVFLLSLFLLAGGAHSAFASEKNGYFDQLEQGTIVGWGWDSASPNTAIPVTVSIVNQETGETVQTFHSTAAVFRQDLIDEGIGNGCHGFRISVNWDGLPDGSYRIEGTTDKGSFDNTQTYQKGKAAESPQADQASQNQSQSPQKQAQGAGLVSLGLFRTTAYCPCQSCTAGWGRRTSSGATATASHTIAVDPRVIPMGSKLLIGGVVYTAEDKGGGVKGNHIDIFVNSHSQARQYGRQTQEVFLITG